MNNTSTNTKNLGSGIKIISITQIIVSTFTILIQIATIALKNVIQQQLDAIGNGTQFHTEQIIILLIIRLLIIIGVVLILLKKTLGVYIYFTSSLLNLSYSLIMTGFKVTNLLTLLALPILMLFFILKKKHIYRF
jgi:hypothetical protein